MADSYERFENEGGGGGFLLGLLTGAVLGAGLGLLLAPKAGSDLRGAIGEQAKNWGNKASEQYKRASETAGQWAERGREAVGKVRESVQRGVDEGRTYAGGTDYGTSSQGSFGGNTATGTTDFGRS
jgi:gas vesicle protein